MIIGGFTQFPNNILSAMYMRRFSARQMRIVAYIVRMTEGCHSRVMNFTNADFQVCGLYKGAIKRELNKLEALEVIKINWEEGLVSINVATWEWKVPQNANLTEEMRSDLVTSKLSKQLRKRTVSVTKRANGGSPRNESLAGKEILKKVNKTGFSSIGEILEEDRRKTDR